MKFSIKVLSITLLLASASAQAHFPWLLVANPYPDMNKEAKIYMGWGHSFPLDGFMDKDRISSLTLITPDGVESKLEMKNDVEFRSSPLLQSGVHIVLANQGKGYYTKTKKGGERKPKTGLTDVVRCYYSDNSMKSIFNEGEDGILSKRFGHSLEIIPLSNPADLKSGDYMPVQVLYRGNPYDGMVMATYEGFSTDDAFAYAIDTDNDGKANIRMLDRGRWLIHARLEEPYPDPNVCDVEAFTSTLTFTIR